MIADIILDQKYRKFIVVNSKVGKPMSKIYRLTKRLMD